MLYFPHPLTCDDEGLVAIGGDLSYQRLELAYSFGLFPWYNQEPILWWFTHPRCIIYTDQIKLSKSMRSLVYNKRPWKVTIDQAFDTVIENCSEIKRQGQNGTWITNEIKNSYSTLHSLGVAHSVEVWSKEGNLIGGLYGVVKGKIFFGESMFAKKANASKYALIYLAAYLLHLGCEVIDCQQDTDHMRSMGAVLLSKDSFWDKVKHNTLENDLEISSLTFNNWLVEHLANRTSPGYP